MILLAKILLSASAMFSVCVANECMQNHDWVHDAAAWFLLGYTFLALIASHSI